MPAETNKFRKFLEGCKPERHTEKETNSAKTTEKMAPSYLIRSKVLSILSWQPGMVAVTSFSYP
jgi:hypothetical protein